MTQLTRATLSSIGRYGREKCLKAFALNHGQGEGASTIGIMLGLTTRQADAAINAGREIAASEQIGGT